MTETNVERYLKICDTIPKDYLYACKTRKHSSRMRTAHFGGHHKVSVMTDVYTPPWVYLSPLPMYTYPVVYLPPLRYTYSPWIPTLSPSRRNLVPEIPNPLEGTLYRRYLSPPNRHTHVKTFPSPPPNFVGGRY